MASTSPSEAANALVTAWVSREWIEDPALFPAGPKDIDDMYKTHLAAQEHPAVAELGGHGGYKLGAVGALGQPCFYGPLFARFIVEAPDRVSSTSCQVWQAEPEFGLILGEDLPQREDGATYEAPEVWAAVESVVLCIELCGRRASAAVLEEQPRLAKMADLLSSGGVVLGLRLPAKSLDAAALPSCETALKVNGAEVVKGSGAACPEGGPLQALTWLANHLCGRGLGLKKGQLVITGATCITTDFKVGDEITASFAGLGSVETTLDP